MFRITRRFLQLSTEEQKLVLQAAPLLVISVMKLRLLGFRHCHDSLAVKPALQPGRHDLPDAAALAVMRASNGLRVGTCLSRSLALRALLRRKGIETKLRIGVDKKQGAFKAHAWLELNGVPVGGEVIPRDYSVFAEIK